MLRKSTYFFIILLCGFVSIVQAEDLYDKYKDMIGNGNDSNPKTSSWKGVAKELQAIATMEQGIFEKTTEFQARREKAIQPLEARIESAAKKGDNTYQAGTVTMTGYNPDKELLTVKVSWQSDVVAILKDVEKIQKSSFQIVPDAAKSSFGQQATQPLFVTVTWDENALRLREALVFVNGKAFSLLSADIGSAFRDCDYCPEMVWIPPTGNFTIGSPSNESERHGDENQKSGISIKRFAVGKYEVTFAEYDRFAAETGRSKPNDEGWGRGNLPVINVSWHDAVAYTKWLSNKTGHQYRLPTEAEWEYAARGKTQTRYWWGNEIGRNNANCDGCGSQWDDKQTAPVGSFKANLYGLYDVHGNVWEWTCSAYSGSYNGSESRCDNSDGGERMLRGGSWYYVFSGLRAALRGRAKMDLTHNSLGVRVVREL